MRARPSFYFRPARHNSGASMNTTDTIFHRAVSKLLIEIFDGPPGSEAYILNPGDIGLLRQLESIPADVASTPPGPGRPTIAAHADHVRFGLSLLVRWVGGEADPFSTADWNASWKRITVSEEEWRAIRDTLRKDADTWQRAAQPVPSGTRSRRRARFQAWRTRPTISARFVRFCPS